jgi:hypothetical protein
MKFFIKTTALIIALLFSNLSLAKEKIFLKCETAVVELSCNNNLKNQMLESNRICNDNFLYISFANKKTLIKPTNSMIKNNLTFTGVKCSKNINNNNYIIVEVSKGFDCITCGYFIESFNLQGQRVTINGKSINKNFKQNFLSNNINFLEIEPIQRM